MKVIVIIAIAFVLLVPTSAFAQYMGNVGDGELEETIETQTESTISENSSVIDPTGADCLSEGFWVIESKSCGFFAKITNDSTGGDCTKIGDWNNSTQTCFLSGQSSTWSETNGILIEGTGITLDGKNGVFRGSYGTGLAIINADNINVKNINMFLFPRNLVIINSNNVTLSNFESSNSSGGSLTGNEIKNSSNIEFLTSTLHNQSMKIKSSKNISFSESSITKNIGVIDVEGIKFEKSTIHSSLHFEGTSDILILDNNLNFHAEKHPSIRLSDQTKSNHNVSIINNTLKKGILIENQETSVIISHNTFLDPYKSLEFEYGTGKHTISNNIFKDGAVRIFGNPNSLISNNSFEHESHGLILIGSQNNIISENNFYQFSPPVDLMDAIDLYEQKIPNTVSSGNVFSNNYWSGYDSEEEGCFDEDLDDYCDEPLLVSEEFLNDWAFNLNGGTLSDNWKEYHSQDALFSKSRVLPNEISENIVKPKEIIPEKTEPPTGKILSFVDPEKDPFHYINRYINEPKYKEWFDSNYPDFTIYEAVGISQEEYFKYLEPKPDPEPELICGDGTEWIDGECRPSPPPIEIEEEPTTLSKQSNTFTNSGLIEDQWVKYQLTMVDLDASGTGMYFSPEAFEASLIESFIPIDESGNELRNTEWFKFKIDTVTNSKYKMSSYAGLTNGDEVFLKSQTNEFELNDDFKPLVIPVNLEEGDVITMGGKEFEIEESVLTVNDKKLDVFILTNEERKADQGIVSELFSESIYHKNTGMLLLTKVEMSARGQGNSADFEFGIHAIDVSDHFLKKSSKSNRGGGCLIATATFDSELSPQVQKLREIRDSKLLQTESGSAFMESFNQFYYSFSPVIADYERENPVFKEMVKIGVTPLLTTLSLMYYAESESEVLTVGISLIILNGMMYVGVPVIGIIVIRRF